MIEDRISSEAAALLNAMMYEAAARRKANPAGVTKSGYPPNSEDSAEYSESD